MTTNKISATNVATALSDAAVLFIPVAVNLPDLTPLAAKFIKFASISADVIAVLVMLTFLGYFVPK